MRKSKTVQIILVIISTFLAYFFLIPLLFMLFTSFKALSDSVSSVSLLPKIWTLDNYVKLLADTTNAPIMHWLFNTAVVTVIGTAVVLFVDVLAAYAMARLDLPFTDKIIVGIIWVMSIPGVVTLFPSFYIFRKLNLLDSFIPLILPYSAGVMGVYLIYNFLKDFPKELEEAAVVDGASLVKILIHVVLPSIKPVVMTLGFITFLGIYNDFLWPSLMATSNEMRTITVGIGSLITGSNFSNPGMMMAATMFSVIPAMVIFLLVNKYIVHGITNVGIK